MIGDVVMQLPSTSTRVLAVAVAIVFLVAVLELIRRRKLQERYTVVWFVAGLGLLVLALAPGLLVRVSSWAGIADPNSALFGAAIVVSGALLLNLTVTVSRQGEQIARLAQEVAHLNARLDEVDDAGDGAEDHLASN